VEQLREIVPDIQIDKAVLSEPESSEKVASPGMKYKHYSPKAEILLAVGDEKAFVSYCNKNAKNFDIVLCFEEEMDKIKNIKTLSFGGAEDFSAQAELIFAKLRELDLLGAKKVIAHAPDKKGVGLAVYNRLVRAAGFKVIDL
jgi:L-threonylcarbamoyladenylate synthase